MGRQTWISGVADRVMEACWLLVLVFIPYFFNLQTARHFEPDKATALRALVLVMLAAWLIKSLERITVVGERLNWRGWWRAPLALPTVLYGGTFLLSTLFSVDPAISWWGGYNRLQGTYTNLSYIALFAVIAGNLRTRAQLDRLITTMILTALAVATYGLLQHADLDPLPWRGDTAARIASTMGNSIFVAAYLIMVIPFVLFRLGNAISQLGHAPRLQNRSDWAWIGLLVVGLLAQQAFLLGQIKFGAAVRTADFRYWWVFPGALAILTASFALISTHRSIETARRLPIFCASALGAWILLLLLMYTATGESQQLSSDPRVADWWLWTLLGSAGIGLLAGGALLLPRRDEDSRVWFMAQIAGYGAVLVVLLLAIFYSQSRGPQIGLMAGLVAFIDLLLVRRWRAARQTESPRARRWGTALVVAGLLQVAGLAFLVLFNVSDAPVFAQLRKVPYVGRLGELTETGEGTGRVRVLIWKGDEKGAGALGLITSNPVRALIGYGPETMFTVYNPYYPPELARYEARGASPDRSHQAQLDELVHKGALGLLSYLFLFLSAGALAWRLFWRSLHVPFQLLYLASFAAIVAHLFEGLTGIPIVSTLTLLWVSFAMLIAGGKLEGQLAPSPVQEEAPAPVETAAATAPATPKARGGRGARAGATPRGAAAKSYQAAPRKGGSLRWTYVPVAILVLIGVWFWNLKVVYADMFYNQAQGTGTTDVNTALTKYLTTLRAVQLAPEEDYYHLQLGNALIQLGYNFKLRNAQSEADVAPPRPNQRFEDLFQGATLQDAAINMYRNNSGFQILEYARLVLERAERISPTNKDHPANLGRLHALWYQLTSDTTKLNRALDWYAQANRIAPNDVVILNEWATNLASAGAEKYPEVEQKFKQSIQLDPRFIETYVKLGNFYRVTNRLPEAGEQYGEALRRNPNALSDANVQVDEVIQQLRSDPAALQAMLQGLQASIAQQRSDADLAALPDDQERRWHDDYAKAHALQGRIAAALNDKAAVQSTFDRALQLAPENVTVHQQYTLALSDTLQFDAALDQAQAGLQLAQAQQRSAEVDTFTKLITTLQQRQAGGTP